MFLRRLIPFIFLSVLFSQDYLKIYTIPTDHKLFDELIVNALDQHIRIKESLESSLLSTKSFTID